MVKDDSSDVRRCGNAFAVLNPKPGTPFEILTHAQLEGRPDLLRRVPHVYRKLLARRNLVASIMGGIGKRLYEQAPGDPLAQLPDAEVNAGLDALRKVLAELDAAIEHLRPRRTPGGRNPVR